MNTATSLIISISLALCQAQSSVITESNTTAIQITEPTVSPTAEVTAQTLSVTDSVLLTANETAINEILSFGETVIFVVSERLPSLSPEMRPIGEKILADTKIGLQSCEMSLWQNGSIWEYKICCSSHLRYAMSSFSGLAQESIRSGAGRPTFFFM